MLDDRLLALGHRAGDLLIQRGQTVAVAEGSCGGLVSTALLAVPGASAYYRGGAVIYTAAAVRGLLGTAVARPEPLRGASEPFARWLAEEVAADLGATWGIGEGGATGPSGNPYGDPPGHCWTAVHGPNPATRHLLTGDDDRLANMTAFATAALQLLVDQLR
jgi:PncC family amidohydrolase